ncbi:MAG: DUF6797 domain-containing protein [Pirellulales bacterium]
MNRLFSAGPRPAVGQVAASLLLALALTGVARAQFLESQLLGESREALAVAARREGDAPRGAILFHQAQLACGKCHPVSGMAADAARSLGPDLTQWPADTTDAGIVEAILEPNKKIRSGFETSQVTLTDGRVVQGIIVERTGGQLVLREATRFGERLQVSQDLVEEVRASPLSLMPAGQVNQLTSRQQFLDLVKYVFEIRAGGAERARQLQPPPSLLAFTLPEYEERLDHAGIIRSWNNAAFERGEKLYQRVCANCHGTVETPGSLPTSLRFAAGQFKNGSDPLAMYRTLTRGFGLMAPQTWMVPQQKYDVIHYIRETYLRPHNPSQFVAVDSTYLDRLPRGNTRGPAPSTIEPWVVMDYGPSLINTYEFPAGPTAHRPNLAYKGLAVRLDPGPGGISRGRHWAVFDHDTLRMAGVWSQSAGPRSPSFIDWGGIQFDGRHGVHPHVSGQVSWTTAAGPGWGEPSSGSFADQQRVVGRDGRTYGPLPHAWGRFRGFYHHGLQTILSYRVDSDCDVLELPRLAQRAAPRPASGATSSAAPATSRTDPPPADSSGAEPAEADAPPVLARQLNIGPRRRELLVNVAQHPAADRPLKLHEWQGQGQRAVAIVPADAAPNAAPAAALEPQFDGQTYWEVSRPGDFQLAERDFTVTAHLRTERGGTIFALAAPGERWVPNGQSLFVRGGRLCFDIGWVGAVTGKSPVADGRWHHVAVSWHRESRRVRLYVDGRLDGEGTLAAKGTPPSASVRLGFTAPDFPQPQSHLVGQLAAARFYQRLLTEKEVAGLGPDQDTALLGSWKFAAATAPRVVDQAGRGHDAQLVQGNSTPEPNRSAIVAGLWPPDARVSWRLADDGHLRLVLPAGTEPLRFTVWTARIQAATDLEKHAAALAQSVYVDEPDRDLTAWTHGGPARWPQKLTIPVTRSPGSGPFEIDILTLPTSNPWLAQLRPTGFDFYPDGDRAAVCTWDGDVWLVSGLSQLDAPRPSETSPPSLVWQRIASGLFQPLGLKLVAGTIYCTCRDQLVALRDLNGDGETDFYECVNSDHQVTEHFHEFAMGLQTDDAGNFYYAKSARHALPAVVPHHGTLLRISRDGSRTDILATGFRAANGVCLNPDGSFIVTDQEGHWNPKNRINWVQGNGPSEFFGNMFGYHDVTDSSDAAMRPPLCWITNAFDRSPAELLWVTSERWGPLRGALLNLSYGYGKIYVVPHENVAGQMQGGMCELPLPVFPTGLIRGRFHPRDGQLYTCGMFAWAGSATQPGGWYRVRYTGQPIHVPLGLSARPQQLRITFSGELDPAVIADVERYTLTAWSLKRSANYGSNHHDEHRLKVSGATLSDDRRTLTLDVPELAPTWCIETRYRLRSADGHEFQGAVHHTIHRLEAGR